MEKLKVKNWEKFTYFKYLNEVNPSIELGEIITQSVIYENGNKDIAIGVVIQIFSNGEFRTDDYGIGNLDENYCNTYNYTRSTLEEIKQHRPSLLIELENSQEKNYKGNLDEEIFNHSIIQDYIKECNGLVFGYLGECDNERTYKMDYYVSKFLKEFTKSKNKIANFLISSNGRHCVPRLHNHLYDNNNEEFKKILKHFFKTM